MPEVVGRCDQRAERTAISTESLYSIDRGGMNASEGDTMIRKADRATAFFGVGGAPHENRDKCMRERGGGWCSGVGGASTVLLGGASTVLGGAQCSRAE